MLFGAWLDVNIDDLTVLGFGSISIVCICKDEQLYDGNIDLFIHKVGQIVGRRELHANSERECFAVELNRVRDLLEGVKGDGIGVLMAEHLFTECVNKPDNEASEKQGHEDTVNGFGLVSAFVVKGDWDGK